MKCALHCVYSLGTFAKLWKVIIASSCLSVGLSAPLHGTTRIPLDEFHEILHLRIFKKSVKKIHVPIQFQFDRNKGYFT